MKTQKTNKSKTRTTKEDIAKPYNQYKYFQGKQYTGMAIGRSHKWYYDQGIWHDKKITPDKWIINFEVTKRRAGKAPEGSGAAVGTEYHWYILAHQMVKKLDANSYSTAMNGLKFKLAHKRSNKDKWNITDKTQKNHLIKILKGFIKELENESVEEFVSQEQDIIKSIKQTGNKLKKVLPINRKVKKTAVKKDRIIKSNKKTNKSKTPTK